MKAYRQPVFLCQIVIFYVEFSYTGEYNENNIWRVALNDCCALPRAGRGGGGGKAAPLAPLGRRVRLKYGMRMIMENSPTELYHYCSLETFLNIVRNRTIRLSDITKSNDYLETKTLLSYIEAEAIKQYMDNPISDDTVIISGLSNEQAIKYLLKIETQKILKRHDCSIYAVCFSAFGDMLSQWRGYADDGRGVSIGFNPDSINALCENSPLLISKVEYIGYDYSKADELIINYSHNILEDILSTIRRGNTFDLYFHNLATSFISYTKANTLMVKSVFYKNASFSEEQEWRLVLNQELLKKEDDLKEDFMKRYENWFPQGLNFRCVKDDIISYLDLKFKSNLITRIIIGPKSKINEDDIKQILTCFGYDLTNIKVKKSSSTYR